MLDRIRQLIQVRQLSPTQFADAIGVARPIVSHILGGRNKPSLEVVQKIIAAFPDVALLWLLSGQGDMLAAAPSAPSTAALTTAPSPTPARSVRRSPRGAENPSSMASAAPVAVPQLEPEVNTIPVAAEPTLAPEPAPVVPGPAVAPVVAATGSIAAEVAPLLTASAKSIRRVLIFYNDGTFADFSPSPDNF